MSASIFLPRTIKLGEGSLLELGNVAKELTISHLLIITGTLLAKEQFRNQVEQRLHNQGLKTTFYIHNKGEPTTEHLDDACNRLDQTKADGIVAIGGGSVIDLAKAVSFIAKNKEATLDDIPNVENLKRLPFIAVPTTAGTGSEATKVTVITDSQQNIKKNPAHPRLIPDAAILDPNLTITLPKSITAYTGLDALAHAMEAYVSTKATPMSDHFALEAIRLIGENLPKAYLDGEDIVARRNMLLGSCYAGIAFTNASTNLAHAMARPLGTRFSIPHGLSVALLLPFVIEFGLDVCEERYANIALALGSEAKGRRGLAEDCVKIVHQFNTTFDTWEDGITFLTPINQVGNGLPLLITDALSGNGIQTNRKVPTEKDVEKVYLDLFRELNIR